MAIVINGTGTVTGISVGGLPDDIVDSGTLANDVVVSTSGAITTTGAFTSIGIDDNADANAITIDSSENVGIGVTPESWHSSYTALQVGGTGSIFAHLTQAAGSDLHINQNAYYDNAWRYIVTDEATNFVTNDGQFRFRVAASGTADAAISWTTAMTIANDGDVTVDTGNLVIGTAGKGIDFSAQTATSATGAAATSEVLDHYEEGTWTPTIKDATGNLATLSTANGSYTKIGRWVQINFQITLSSKESMTGNYVLMGGIPFNHPTQAYNGTGVIDTWTNFATSFSGLWFDTSSTGSLMWLSAVAGAGSTSYELPVVDDLNDNSHMKGSCMYQISV